jgi:BASS family bile acid:Na+ symporter
MNGAAIVGVALPAALAFIMFCLGLTLRVADFRQVLRRPRALAVGLAGQLLMLPLAGLLVAAAFARGGGLPATMAVGLMVLAACPGGVSSGLLTLLARGDVALSIVLTAVSSVAAMATLPLVLDASLQFFAQQALQVELPLGNMVRRIFALTTVPVLAGMALRAWAPRAVQRVERNAGRVATALFVAIVLATFWSQRQVLFEHFGSVGPACVALNVLVLGIAWTASGAAGLQHRDRVAVAIECGLQNSALGIYVTLELLRAPAMSVPSVVYALLMNAGALAFVALMRWPRGHARADGGRDARAAS